MATVALAAAVSLFFKVMACSDSIAGFPAYVKAGPLKTVLILLRSVYLTLHISVSTIVDVYLGRYRREWGDRRMRWWADGLFDAIGLSCRVIGRERASFPPGRPCMIMSNHGSLYDIPLIFKALPGSIRMLTKKELFRVPIWGRGLKVGEYVSIDRHNRDQAMRDLADARRKMEDGIVLWVAPEGTRSRDGRLGAFKKGGFMLALETGAMILPVGIRGAREVLVPKTLGLNLGRTAEVRVGNAVDASRYTVENREALMTEVRRQIRELAGLEDGSAAA